MQLVDVLIPQLFVEDTNSIAFDGSTSLPIKQCLGFNSCEWKEFMLAEF